MAQLIATPKYIATAMSFVQGEKFDVYLQRSTAAFEKLEAVSDALPPGEVVGALITFPWADGQAVYRVASAKPLRVEHIPYMDAWQVAPMTIRGLNLDDVKQMVESRRALKSMFSRNNGGASDSQSGHSAAAF